MKKLLLLILFGLIPGILIAQFAVVSTEPANNATNVPLNVTLSITFTEALDTVAMKEEGNDGWFTNIDSTVSYGYSADQKTAWSTHVLKPNTAYFFAFMRVKAKSGALITSPHVYYFTTGATFPANSVSGTISQGSVNVSPAGSVVGLSKIDFMHTDVEGPPPFGGWANVNNDGSYTIPYVPNGTYWPLVAKDVNGDGRVNPEHDGDIVVMGDSIVVNNASVTGVNMTFFAILSVQPANLSTNVPLVTTISMTFSEPLDTMAMQEHSESSWFTNIDSVISYGYSADRKTSYATVALKPNTSYFMTFSYAKSEYGSVITSSHVYYFTTGANFSPYSVSGTISMESSGQSPEGSVAGLSKVNFMEMMNREGPPPFGGWANVNANGTFTIPYVANGTYWPLIAKDVNHDGNIDPGRGGDILIVGDSIIVNNASVTGVVIKSFSVVSVEPANLTTNVPLNTTISITFSEPIDEEAMQNGKDNWFSSIDSVADMGFSNNGKTIWSTVVLKPNTTYFIAFMYVRSQFGSVLTKPQMFYFTTGSAFPTLSVSGTVSSGSTGVPPGGSIVGLSKINFMNEKTEGPPPFGGWGEVNDNGTFTIPYVENGTYWPLSFKDVNGDGEINPDNGVDVMAIGDSIVVNNASVTGVNLTFLSIKPNLFSDVTHIADSMAAVNLPADHSLRRINAWEVDTLGRARSWEFAYSVNGNTMGKIIRIGTMDRQVDNMDPNYFQWVSQMKPVTGYLQAASSATVIANVEAAGGRQVRLQQIPPEWEFRIELTMSDQKNGWFGGGPFPPDFDTSKIYWTAAYAYNYQINPDQSQWMGGKLFLCDLTTGAVIKSQQIWVGVKDQHAVPTECTLSQNYPNPFNPTTNITFAIPSSNVTSLKVFDVLGQEIAVLVNEKKDAGTYTVPFNAARLPSGVYFYQLRSGSFVETKKMLLLK